MFSKVLVLGSTKICQIENSEIYFLHDQIKQTFVGVPSFFLVSYINVFFLIALVIFKLHDFCISVILLEIINDTNLSIVAHSCR